MRPSNSFKSFAWVETASGDCSRDISSLVQLAGQRRERQQSKVSYLPTIFTAIYAFHIKLDHFKFYFDIFLHQNPLEYVIRRCPVKFWAQYWPSWLLRNLKKFEKNHWLRHSTGHMTTLDQPEHLYCCFVLLLCFWLDKRMVECRNQL